MPGSVHDTVQRSQQRQTAMRRGKHLQRALRGVAVKLRRRKAMATAIAALVVLVATLCIMFWPRHQRSKVISAYMAAEHLHAAPHDATEPGTQTRRDDAKKNDDKDNHNNRAYTKQAAANNDDDNNDKKAAPLYDPRQHGVRKTKPHDDKPKRRTIYNAYNNDDNNNGTSNVRMRPAGGPRQAAPTTRRVDHGATPNTKSTTTQMEHGTQPPTNYMPTQTLVTQSDNATTQSKRDTMDALAAAAALHVRNAPPVTASPSDHWLLRPDVQHGGDDVRVMLLMVSTHVDAQLCYALASAYFADLPVVVVGYDAPSYVNAMKPSLYLDAIERAGLRDRDVVLLLDSDILFSGEDMLPFIDDYIARSPAAPSALDMRAVRGVRAGTMLAPSLFVGEGSCYVLLPGDTTERGCKEFYNEVDEIVVNYAKAHSIVYDYRTEVMRPLRYLNSGVSIHRVWSAREVMNAYVKYIAAYSNNLDDKENVYFDQSVLALFYNELRAWEVERDILASVTVADTTRGPHGLRAGQLQLEYSGRLYVLPINEFYGYTMFSDAKWAPTADAIRPTHLFMVSQAHEIAEDVWDLYGSSVRLQQRTLTRVGDGTHTIDLTPPLLYIASHYNSEQNRQTVLVKPLLLHNSDKRKRTQLLSAMQVLPWYMPLYYNATRWQQASAQVLATTIELWTATTNTTKRVRYGDVCQQQHLFVKARRTQ